MARTKGSKNSKPRAKKVVPDTIVVDDKKYILKKLEITDEGKIDKLTATIEDLMRRIESGKLDMNPLIQRTNDQWNSKQRSKLIISILKNRPIGTITVSRSDGINEKLVDGLQRLTTIRDFLNDKFPLAKDGSVISCVWTDEDDPRKSVVEDINLGGKRFSQLPELFKNYITECRVDFHIYWYFSDEEMDDIMFCMNNGSPFKPWQKMRANLGETRIEAIQPILESTAWEKIRGCNDKNDTTLGLVIRTMMLLDGCGYNSLSVSAAEKYINEVTKDGIATFNAKVTEVAKLFEDFDYIATQLPEEDWTFFDVTNTPLVLDNISEFNRSDKSLDDYVDFIHKFINNELDDNENNIREYNNVKKKSKGSGTKEVGNSVIEARHWIFANAMDNYFFPEEDIDDETVSDSDAEDKISKISEEISVDSILDGMEFNTEIVTASEKEQAEYDIEKMTYAIDRWGGTDDCDEDFDDGRDDEYNLDEDEIYISSYSDASSY